MSGIEIAGLVLGAFPILLKCLEEYRRGFEPLDEWWHFHSRFIAFVDAIRHQMMLFHGNMIRMLDPIITNNNDLFELASNGADPRWKNGSLSRALETRLASELDRLIRIIGRMHGIVKKLEALLQIQDGQVSWLGNKVESPPWQWHFNRLRIAFDKNKHRKVRQLGEHNQELKEILGFGEEMLVVASRRGTTTHPTQHLDKVRQDALRLFNALSQAWSCNGCQEHQANLKLRHDATVSELEMLLVVRSSPLGAPSCLSQSHRVSVRSGADSEASREKDVRLVPQSSILSDMQLMTEKQLAYQEDRPTLSQRISDKIKGKGLMLTSAVKNPRGISSATRVPASSSSRSSVMVIESRSSSGPEAEGHAGPSIPMRPRTLSTFPPPAVATCHIQSLCTFLGDSVSMKGTLSDEFARLFELTKDPQKRDDKPPFRLSLHEMLEAYQKQPPAVELPRRTRFEMAAHIASALLQTNQSPWLLDDWSKHNFYFLINPTTRKVENSHAFVSRSFPTNPADTDTQATEEVVHQCLRGVGIMIMELVFGCHIERSSTFRAHSGDSSVDRKTYLDSAKQWQRRLESESGQQVAAAVFRCLYDHGFGQPPRFGNSSFRKEIYEQVVQPLANYKENWVLEPEV